MTGREWRRKLAGVPKGLSMGELADRLGYSYKYTWEWCVKSGHHIPIGHPESKKLRNKLSAHRIRKRYPGIDAKLKKRSNIDISRELGCTREYLRQVREILGYPKIEARGRPKKGT